MNSKSSKDNLTDIQDSTDWLATPLPSLAGVDAALRCQVCKDLYTTPMITSCSHTFCSLCIRRCLGQDGKCPVCRASDQEMKLRQNWAVGELVEAFKKARPEIYEFATRPVARSDSPKRKLDEVEDATSPPQKRTRSGRRIQSSSQVIILDPSDGEDGDYVPGGKELNDGLVACPICSDRMTVEAVQIHIDSCDGTPQSNKQATWNPKKPATRPERLPHPHYSGLKDNALRKKLADQGITASGPRQLMERRYTEWVTLWNANCDSLSPKGKGDLKRELDIWERTQGGKANTAGREQILGAQIKDKDFDGKAWAQKNDEAFRELIAQARRKPKAQSTVSEPNIRESNSAGGDTHITPSLPPDFATLQGASGPESQILYNKQQDAPLETHTVAVSPHFQSTPSMDRDHVSSPDIGTIKPL